MEPPGTPPLFSDDVPLCFKRGLEMNVQTSLTFLYSKHVPLEQVPKKKASKSEKNLEKKPEEEPEKKPEEEPEKKTEEEPEKKPEEEPETQPEACF